MDNCGSFQKYAQSFQRQAAEVCPSKAEKIHNFKRGLTSALQNAVLLDTTTREPWTEFAPLLKVATSFANEMQGKQSHVTAHVDNAGRSRRDSRGQRSERPARPGRGQAPASSEKKEARTRTMGAGRSGAVTTVFSKATSGQAALMQLHPSRGSKPCQHIRLGRSPI